MKRTTPAQVEDVLARFARGETHTSIVATTGLSKNVVSRIKDGWRPSGRKPVRLVPSIARQRGER
jgi:hypothetical protein